MRWLVLDSSFVVFPVTLEPDEVILDQQMQLEKNTHKPTTKTQPQKTQLHELEEGLEDI